MIVMKFGGTSLATPARLRRVAGLVAASAAKRPTAVVVSALAGVTDALVDAWEGRLAPGSLALGLERRHRRYCRDGHLPWVGRWVRWEIRRRVQEARSLAGREAAAGPQRDRLLAIGERLSVPLAVAALFREGVRGEPIDGSDLLVLETSGAEPQVDLEASGERIRQRIGSLPPSVVPVITGFIGADSQGRTRTLGRGGSDTSATVLGVALGVAGVEIWSDVDGVYSADPAVVPRASPISRLSFADAAAMARLGASVIHEDCIPTVAAEGIPVRVMNSLNPRAVGTRIGDFPDSPEPLGVASVPAARLALSGVGQVPLRERAAQVEAALGRRGIHPLLSSPRPGGWAWVLRREQAAAATAILRSHGGAGGSARWEGASPVATVALVGGAPAAIEGAAREVLEGAGIPVLESDSGERSWVLVVDPSSAADAQRALHGLCRRRLRQPAEVSA